MPVDYSFDLEPSKLYFRLPNYHVMDATQTDFDANSIDSVSLQCAFEMFLKNDDMKLIRELGRILKPGGRAIICPLYIHTKYCGYCSPDYWHRKEFHDQNAKLFVSKSSFGIPFSRKYDVVELQKRVLEIINQNDMDYNILILRNSAEIDPEIYCHFILEIRKKEF
jgi:ubiquinone/menaquinone biosynthesis C-methylase UbiE